MSNPYSPPRSVPTGKRDAAFSEKSSAMVWTAMATVTGLMGLFLLMPAFDVLFNLIGAVLLFCGLGLLGYAIAITIKSVVG